MLQAAASCMHKPFKMGGFSPAAAAGFPVCGGILGPHDATEKALLTAHGCGTAAEFRPAPDVKATDARKFFRAQLVAGLARHQPKAEAQKRPASSFEHTSPEKGIAALQRMQKEAKGKNQKIRRLEAKVRVHASLLYIVPYVLCAVCVFARRVYLWVDPVCMCVHLCRLWTHPCKARSMHTRMSFVRLSVCVRRLQHFNTPVGVM